MLNVKQNFLMMIFSLFFAGSLLGNPVKTKDVLGLELKKSIYTDQVIQKISQKIQAGEPLLFIALDGGGTKGIIPAAILDDMETKIGKPINQFSDFLVGASTGALLGALFSFKTRTNNLQEARKVLSANEAIQAYKRLSKKIFRKPNPVLVRSRYSNRDLFTAVREALESKRALKLLLYSTKMLQFLLQPFLTHSTESKRLFLVV